MKKLILLVSFFCLTLKFLYAQDEQKIVEFYKDKLDVSTVSMDILKSICKDMKDDFKNKKLSELTNDLIVDFDVKYNLKFKDDIFLSTYKSDLDKAIFKAKENLPSIHFESDLSKFLRADKRKSLVFNYPNEELPKSITPFITPVIQKTFSDFIKRNADSMVNSIENIDELIKKRISYLFANNINLLEIKDVEKFREAFLFLNDEFAFKLKSDTCLIPVTESLIRKTIFFIESNKILIQTNFNTIIEFNKKIQNLKNTNESLQEDLRDLWNNVIYKSNTLNINTELKDEVNFKLELGCNSVKENLEAKIGSIAQFANQIYKYQDDNFKTINDISKTLSNGNFSKKIKEYGQLLERLKNSDLQEYDKKLKEFSDFLEFSTLQTKVIDIFASRSYSFLEKAEKYNNILERGKKIFESGSQIYNSATELFGKIENLKNSNDFLGCMGEVISNAKNITASLKGLNFLSEKDAQNVGEYLNYASAAINIGSSIATGNFAGAFIQTFSLFGSQKPQPSPELQMMKQLMNRIDALDEKLTIKLDQIEAKIDKLTEITVTMYKDMMVGFQLLHEELKNINKKLEDLERLNAILLQDNYKFCVGLENLRKKNNIESFTTYNLMYEVFKNEKTCKNCIEDLEKKLIDPSDLISFESVLTPKKREGEEQFAKYEREQIYEPVMELFNIRYNDHLRNKKRNIINLKYPSKYTTVLNPIYSFTLGYKINFEEINTDQILKRYYDYNFIKQISELVLMYFNLFLMHEKDTYPVSLSTFLNFDYYTHNNNKINLESYLKTLITVTENSLIQQSLISGNVILELIYNIIVGEENNKEKQDLVIKILQFNNNISSNLVTKIINSDKKRNIIDFIDQLKLARKKLEESNSSQSIIINVDDLKFEVKKENTFLVIEKPYKTFNLQLPNYETIIDDQMLFTDGFYEMLDLKEKLRNKYLDLVFTENLDQDKSEFYKLLFLKNSN